MATAAAFKSYKGVSGGQYHTCEFLYDFANDTGATGAYDLGDLPLGMVIEDLAVKFDAACTSAGSGATLILGTTDDTNGFLESTDAETVGVLNATIVQKIATAQPVTNDAASRDVILTIGGENLTAGKIRVKIGGYVFSSNSISE